jgi:4-hydroxymandelate oxidase
MDLVNVYDFEAAARDVMPQMAYDYYASGANDEITLHANNAAYDEIALRYRILVDVSERDLSTTVLGHDVSMPVLIAPTAFHRLAHPDGEVAMARAAEKAGTIMMLSTLSTTPMEEVAAATRAPVWFQLYVYKDRGATEALLQRAKSAGCSAIVLTVDAPLLGKRERDVRNRFQLPPDLSVKNLLAHAMADLPDHPDDSSLAAHAASMFDTTLNWKDIEWLRRVSDLPLIVKGIVHPEDARLATELDVAGVFVSNHGGRQLDTALTTIEALPDVVEVVDGRATVLLDGGIRRGTDIIKAIALGADAVAVGRAPLWGLAVDGEAGVGGVLAILRDELDLAMALCGCTSIDEITADLIA